MGTPWGLHEICEKIGNYEPLGMVFEGRKATGKFFLNALLKNNNVILSLQYSASKGLELGINLGSPVDSFDRYIYIHGTNHEERLGFPASSGCLQMSNNDIMELFDAVDEKTHLWIAKP